MKDKPLKKQLTAQFRRKNMTVFVIAVFGALAAGSLNLILSWLMQQLIDAASGSETVLSLDSLAWISGGFILLCAAVSLPGCLATPRYIARAIKQYKDFAFRKLTEKSISSFRDESTATYLSALTNDATSIEENYLSQQLSVITKTVTFIGALVMMIIYSPLMTAIAVGLTVLPLVASVLTGNRIEAAERRVSDRNKDFTAALSDCLGGFSVIKSFKAEKEIFKLFAEDNRSLETAKLGKRRIKAIVGTIGSTAGMFAQLGVFVIGSYMAVYGYGLTPGTVIVFVNLMNFMIQPVAELPGLLASRKAARGLISKLADALEKNQTTEGGKTVTEVKDAIRLENVSFGYEEGKEILHGVSAVFEAGKSYAVVGGSGSGKSTMLNLLTATDAEYSGKITFDSAEIRDIAPESLYAAISVIQQNVFVFNASVRDNVTMFREFPQAEIDGAIERAHLGELIKERGEDYLCGENGKGLSGGEKQRISVARSLLKRSSVLLADEITAALDAKTAHGVSSDILDLEGITRIVITHSLEEALLRRYDGIIVMKDGRIEENGRFDELMEKKGYFYALFTVAQ